MRRAPRSALRLAVLAFFIFLVLFVYSTLNLTHVDLGYRQHELLQAAARLRLEIDSLQAQRAELLNLERIEGIVRGQLGYQFPAPGQVLTLREGGDER